MLKLPNKIRSTRLLSFGLTFALMIWGESIAFADTVLLLERESSGTLTMPEMSAMGSGQEREAPPTLPEATGKQSVSVFLKGIDARVEFRAFGASKDSPPSQVLLYKGEAKTVYVLSGSGEVLATQTFAEALEGARPKGKKTEQGRSLSFKGSVSIKPLEGNKSPQTKIVGGVLTTVNELSGSVELDMGGVGPMGGSGMPGGGPMGGRMGGGFPGGDRGFPGGGQMPGGGDRGGMPGGESRMPPPSFAMTGQVWTVDTAKVLEPKSKATVAALYRLMMPDNAGPILGPLTKSLIKTMSKKKVLPIESSVSLRMRSNYRQSNDKGTEETKPLHTYLTVMSIRSDVTVPDALLTVSNRE